MGHAPSTAGRRLSSLRQTATDRGKLSDRLPGRLRPVDATAPNILSWLGRSCSAFHRAARHGLYSCSRGGAHDKAKTGVKGRTAYRKFMGYWLKKKPALAARPPAPDPRAHCFLTKTQPP